MEPNHPEKSISISSEFHDKPSKKVEMINLLRKDKDPKSTFLDIVNSDHPDTATTIPAADSLPFNEIAAWKAVFSLENSNQQRFAVSSKLKLPEYVNQDNLLNLKFFSEFYKSDFKDYAPIYIPQESIEHFSPEELNFCNSISKIKNLDFQKFALSNYGSNEVIDENNNLKSKLFLDYYNQAISARRPVFIPPENLENFNHEEKKFWELAVSLEDPSQQHFLLKNPDYAKDGLVTPKFFMDFYQKEAKAVFIPQEIIDKFDNEDDKKIWKAISTASTYKNQNIILLPDGTINYDVFNPDLSIKIEFLNTCLKQKPELNVSDFISKDFINNRPEKETKFWNEILTCNNEVRNSILNKYAFKSSEIKSEVIENINKVKLIYQKIFTSSPNEVIKIKDQLVDLLIDSSQPETLILKINELYERNNLPDVAKEFGIFKIIYFSSDKDGELRFNQETENDDLKLSSVLKNSSELRVLDTVYKDLLKIEIDSGNPTLKKFLSTIQTGQTILDKVDHQGLKKIDLDELHLLNRFLNRVNSLYGISLLGRNNEISPSLQSIDLDSIQQKIDSLKSDLNVKNNQKIIDRISEMFVKPLGYKSIDEVLTRMNESKKMAHERNIANVKNGRLVIHQDDLVKGIQIDDFNQILQSGFVSKEYLGINSESDHTAFAINAVKLTSEDIKKGFTDLISPTSSEDAYILFKNRGQFVRKDLDTKTDRQYDLAHYELFSSGSDETQKDYAIRTGIASSEIGAIVLTESILKDNNKLKKEAVFFNIANNGFYIPVVNMEGKVIFTKSDYDKYRVDKRSINSSLSKKNFRVNDLVNGLKSSPYLNTLYKMDSGVQEKYTIERHTKMMMGQFEKYFASSFDTTLLSKENFRLMLALHDIGKSHGVHETNSTAGQHEYTKRVLTYALQAVETNPGDNEIITSLVDQDIMGDYIKGTKTIEESVKEIDNLSKSLGISSTNLVKTLKMFYMCDAGSYTSDAGGQGILDFLFIFNHKDGENTIEFSKINQEKYRKLLEKISS